MPATSRWLDHRRCISNETLLAEAHSNLTQVRNILVDLAVLSICKWMQPACTWRDFQSPYLSMAMRANPKVFHDFGLLV